MSKRNLFRLALLLVAAGVLAWKHFAAPQTNGGDASARNTGSVAIPANAREFTLGTLAFKACELPQKKSGATTPAFCAPFAVAENRNDPASRKIDLNLALIKSADERADADIVVFFAGGPGQAAVETWPQIAGALAPLRKRHHILLLDQRGTGKSHPFDCEAAKAADPVIRDALVSLFSNQEYSIISNAAGRQKLQEQALQAVRRIVQARLGQPGIEALYFTSFVMQ